MSNWLDLMLEEIDRKEREAQESKKELERRAAEEKQPRQDRHAQSK